MIGTNNLTDTAELASTLPDRLRQFRKRLGLKQLEFAPLIGYSQSGVANLELGRSEPTVGTLYQYIQAGVAAQWLLMGDGPMLASDVASAAVTVETRQMAGHTEYVVKVASN